ncbi:MAG: ATP synthase F1 subunit delta [Bacteroidales bacterium]|jgi:F-type H+-transporting ATPase subunit delta|nr:ATP synthase F1 subunit delta [Bacteroidales bacterium]
MNQSAITIRYAKAFFTFAKEKDLRETLKSDMELIFSICEKSSDFILLLESPVVTKMKKTELFVHMFDGNIHSHTLNFLKLIVENKRESHIPGICRNFLSLIREDQNIKTAVLITASEIEIDTIKKIEKLIEKDLDVKLELSTKVNPDIIGGMILRLEDKQCDASVATQLKKIKQTLLETELK